jgi:hypothetical protein
MKILIAVHFEIKIIFKEIASLFIVTPPCYYLTLEHAIKSAKFTPYLFIFVSSCNKQPPLITFTLLSHSLSCVFSDVHPNLLRNFPPFRTTSRGLLPKKESKFHGHKVIAKYAKKKKRGGE